MKVILSIFAFYELLRHAYKATKSDRHRSNQFASKSALGLHDCVWTKMVTWERLTDKFHRNISSFQHPPTTHLTFEKKQDKRKKFQQSVQFSPPPAFISISEAAVRGRLPMPMIREFVEGVDTRTQSPSLTFPPSLTHTI